jgi:hypothetical protein
VAERYRTIHDMKYTSITCGEAYIHRMNNARTELMSTGQTNFVMVMVSFNMMKLQDYDTIHTVLLHIITNI